jgi:pimeloyl-ACP methyl ester carboxylesterase
MMLDINGMQLHYNRHGEGKPLVWLHGGMGHGPDWRFIFPTEPAGYQLIAPRTPSGSRRGTYSACSTISTSTASRSSG